ncbi:hypothetical protein [Sulfitobacter sp. 1A12779]|uniref:hypothetical protein n=1 Tax=Sulfitobacter sp. 1A12779 TaxID=3368599 RepID=UPI00374692B1
MSMMISLSCGAETVLVCLFFGVMFRRVGDLGRWQGPFGWWQRLVIGAGNENIGRSLN